MKLYKFAVIMSVYNVEEYINEAVDSIINQTIGFRDNIQIIFVDDGSSDNSGDICDSYKKIYPDNVTVIHKKNEGLAKARLTGMSFVKADYVSFFDPDDILSEETLLNVDAFFRNNESIDIVAIPIMMFGEQKGEHRLNIKFKDGTRIINLEKDYEFIQMSMASAFFRKDCLKGIGGDASLPRGEDAKELIKILIKKPFYGVLKEAMYYYRRRITSNTYMARNTKRDFLIYLENFSEWAIEYCFSKIKIVPKFVQYMIIYDLQSNYRQEHIPKGVLSNEEIESYREKLLRLVKYVDVEIIQKQKSFYKDYIIYLIYKKYNKTPDIFIPEGGKKYCLGYKKIENGDSLILTKLDEFLTCIEFIGVVKNKVVIEGHSFFPVVGLNEPKFYFKVNGFLVEVEKTGFEENVYSVEKVIGKRIWFKGGVSIPADNIEFVIEYNNVKVKSNRIIYGKNSPIQHPQSYYYKNGFIIRFRSKDRKSIKIYKAGRLKRIIQEFKFCKKLIAEKRINIVLNRIGYYIVKIFAPKNIWLILDKAEKAGDNGEAIFEYLKDNKDRYNCYPIFAIDKKSPDYIRVKSFGKTVPYMSIRHKIIHLLASRTISAYSHNEITSPFLKKSYYYSDLLQNSKVVFLQHGITKDDVSKGLNRKHKNFSLFITSSVRERESIFRYPYGYHDNHVVLTGMPRYDYLFDKKEKIITVMPTWRRNLVTTYNPKTSQWKGISNFEDSQYFKFYISLLNSKKLIQEAELLNYKLEFLPHPVFMIYRELFKKQLDERIFLYDNDVSCRDVFSKSSLVLTDYSSVVFDFVYLKKPVIYCQFDENHYEEGYFDYQRDGFGEIESNVESTVDRIIEYMKNGCKLKDIYASRIDKFFAYHDRNNCERVANAISNIETDGLL